MPSISFSSTSSPSFFAAIPSGNYIEAPNPDYYYYQFPTFILSPSPTSSHVVLSSNLAQSSENALPPPIDIGPSVCNGALCSSSTSSTQVNSPVVVTDVNGNTVATVTISLQGSLISTVSESSDSSIVSSTLTLFFIDANGNFVTEFTNSVEICFNSTTMSATKNSKDTCLSYFDVDQQEWKCVDRCLKYKSQNGTDILCGKTDHFTSFAVLLDSTGGGDECDNETFNNPFTWLSLAFIIFACVLFFIFAVIKDIQVRRRTYLKRKVMDTKESILQDIHHQESRYNATT